MDTASTRNLFSIYENCPSKGSCPNLGNLSQKRTLVPIWNLTQHGSLSQFMESVPTWKVSQTMEYVLAQKFVPLHGIPPTQKLVLIYGILCLSMQSVPTRKLLLPISGIHPNTKACHDQWNNRICPNIIIYQILPNKRKTMIK